MTNTSTAQNYAQVHHAVAETTATHQLRQAMAERVLKAAVKRLCYFVMMIVTLAAFMCFASNVQKIYEGHDAVPSTTSSRCKCLLLGSNVLELHSHHPATSDELSSLPAARQKLALKLRCGTTPVDVPGVEVLKVLYCHRVWPWHVCVNTKPKQGPQPEPPHQGQY